MTTAEFEHRLATVKRQGTERHAWLVYGLIRQRRPQVVVETGTYAGFVTAHIALALMHNGDGGHVYSVDDYSYGEFDAGQVMVNLARVFAPSGVPPCVTLVCARSLDWRWPDRVDMAVLDGDRNLPGFAEEVSRAVHAGATCLTVHDTHHDPNACHYARKFTAYVEGWETINCHMDGGLWVAVKAERGAPVRNADGTMRPCDLTDYVVTNAPSFTLPNGDHVPATP
jgi:hypothetical protein